ncbi:TrbI/VirB10 family protein [Sphingomonas bacterium]
MPPPGTEMPGSATLPSSSASEPQADTPADGERKATLQQRRQRQESARGSKLFASDGVRQSPETADAAATPTAVANGNAGSTSAADVQDRKAAFLAGSGRVAPAVNGGRLEEPAGRYVVLAGSTIAAALMRGLASDLPGQVVAQVTEDVFDSATGKARLIPQGTRLMGEYDARVSYGQSRALVVWTRMILPDGRSIDLDRMIGTDGAGQSGFADRVNNHTGKLLTAGLLSTLFGVGANAATAGGNNADIAFAIRESAGRSVETAGDKIVSRQLDVQPTITVRPGARVRVLVSRDLVLAPWSETRTNQSR